MESLRTIKRKVVKVDVEKRIVTAGIVSTRFCRDILPVYKSEYMQIDYIREVLKWVFEYFNAYKESPGRQIQDLFMIEKDEMKIEQAELIESFLSRISDEFEEEKTFNTDYALDQAINYFKKRSLQLLLKEGSD